MRAAVLARLPAATRAALGDDISEACWRGHDPGVAATVALAGRAALAAMARAVAPAHADVVDAWLAALPEDAAGACTAGPHGAVVDVRGPLAADRAIAAFALAGVDVHAAAAHNLLALVDQPHFARVALELEPAGDAGGRVEGAIHVAVPRTPATSRALADAFGFLVRVVAPDQLATWLAVAPILFDAPADEVITVGLGTTMAWPWAELEVSSRPLAHAGRLAAILGTGMVDPAVTTAREIGGTRWSRTGVRFGSGFGPVFRLPLGGKTVSPP